MQIEQCEQQFKTLTTSIITEMYSLKSVELGRYHFMVEAEEKRLVVIINYNNYIM